MKNPQPLFACVMSPTRYPIIHFSFLIFFKKLLINKILRELAVQIARHFEGLGAVIGVKCVVIVGGLGTTFQFFFSFKLT